MSDKTIDEQDDLQEQEVGGEDVQQLKADLDTAQSEALKNLDGWRRTQADFENYQRRKEGENKELIEFAREVAVAKLLPTLDTLQQGLLHVPDDLSKMDEWKNGMAGTLKQLDSVLAELGVKKIEAVGKKFDPHFHEAVREVPGDEDGVVVEEYQTGYELNGKVIRPSQVVISKKS
ncbi:MAG: nucleotide exchange factor GrpE [Candidatus Doudnabacteria bacterium]|nr:nucleotide exchange factor GrpE [Candidatus Doudnabacteria bacterium]